MRLHVARVMAVVALCGAGTAQAQDTTADDYVEATSFVAMHSGASSGIGTAVRWPLPGPYSLELEVGQRRAEINGLNTSLNLLYDLPRIGIVTPYVAGGIGVEQYGYAVMGPGGRPLPLTGTALTLNAGGGVRVPVNDTWGVRTDARYSNGLGKAPERFRLYNGVTFRAKK